METKQGQSQKKIFLILLVCLLVILGMIYFVNRKTTPPPQTAPVTTTSTTPTNTYGMSQYTDSANGFSFWYPSTLQITPTTTSDSTSFPGGIAVETLQVGPAGGVSITVVNSEAGTIIDEPANHASPINQTEYSYDAATKQWMVSYPQGTPTGTGSAVPAPADISKTTMSGLVMLPSGKRFDTSIIPLSKTEFLVVSDGGGSGFTPELAQTVTQVGATVAPSLQATTLQAEAAASANE